MEITKQAILAALSAIEDPDQHRNIVELGSVKHVAICDGMVKATIELTTSARPAQEQMKERARQAIAALEGVKSVEIETTTKVAASAPPLNVRFQNIKNAIAVSSGKGGVGKSTTAVNLAVALARSGAAVGLLDADVYGPDIPMMLGISGEPDCSADRKLIPHQGHGIKALSIGFFLPSDDDPVVWRGPMIHKFLEQMLTDVDWGELDYLIVDMPPGTGDAQLSITQILPLAGALIVTTPQSVATLDVRKAIAMFQKVEIEVLGIIENMAYFTCPDNGKRYEIFGHGGGRALSAHFGIDLLGQIPINPHIGEGGDRGTPIVVAQPDCEEARVIGEVADKLAAKLAARDRTPKPRAGSDLPVL